MLTSNSHSNSQVQGLQVPYLLATHTFQPEWLPVNYRWAQQLLPLRTQLFSKAEGTNNVQSTQVM